MTFPFADFERQEHADFAEASRNVTKFLHEYANNTAFTTIEGLKNSVISAKSSLDKAAIWMLQHDQELDNIPAFKELRDIKPLTAAMKALEVALTRTEWRTDDDPLPEFQEAVPLNGGIPQYLSELDNATGALDAVAIAQRDKLERALDGKTISLNEASPYLQQVHNIEQASKALKVVGFALLALALLIGIAAIIVASHGTALPVLGAFATALAGCGKAAAITGTLSFLAAAPTLTYAYSESNRAARNKDSYEKGGVKVANQINAAQTALTDVKGKLPGRNTP